MIHAAFLYFRLAICQAFVFLFPLKFLNTMHSGFPLHACPSWTVIKI